MGIGPAALNLYVALAKELKARKTICELGSQDLMPEDFDLSLIEKAFSAPNTLQRRDYSSRSFMQQLGFNYTCIDADGRHGAIKADLNTFLPIFSDFDLVTNHGTTEHVFDQANCFRLMHNICIPGGLFIHIVPTQGYENHGLYSYSQGFFRDLAFANDYEILRLYDHKDQFGTLVVAAMLRSSVASFKVPWQGIYTR